MPKFAFKARNAAGGLVEGSRITSSEKELVTLLRGEGLIVFSVAETRDRAAKSEKRLRKGMKRGGSITGQDMAVFCRQLATLINAGVSILDGIDDVAEMVNTEKFQKILKAIASDIREGSTFSDALRKHQKIFGKVFIALVTVGEKSGKLGKVLLDLSDYQENAVKLKRKVKAASAYPLFIAGFFFLALAGLVLFLIPRFKAMFTSFGADLPLPTKIVMAFSDACLHNFPVLLLLAIGGIVGVTMFYRTPSGRFAIDRVELNMPIFGELITKVVFARFFQTLSTLIKSGTDIVASLDIAAKTTNNLVVEKMVDQIRSKVVEGSTMSEEMAKNPLFPRMVVRMTAIGEKSGKLDELFDKLSDYYGDEVDAAVAMMSSLIEPVLIVSLGLVVGIFVVVMYLPIFRLAGAVLAKQ
jgi:type IV pilus assembly protein PilC